MQSEAVYGACVGATVSVCVRTVMGVLTVFRSADRPFLVTKRCAEPAAPLPLLSALTATAWARPSFSAAPIDSRSPFHSLCAARSVTHSGHTDGHSHSGDHWLSLRRWFVTSARLCCRPSNSTLRDWLIWPFFVLVVVALHLCSCMRGDVMGGCVGWRVALGECARLRR